MEPGEEKGMASLFGKIVGEKSDREMSDKPRQGLARQEAHLGIAESLAWHQGEQQ